MPPPKFLKSITILCFERRFSKQSSVIRLKSNILAPPKLLGWLRHWSTVKMFLFCGQHRTVGIAQGAGFYSTKILYRLLPESVAAQKFKTIGIWLIHTFILWRSSWFITCLISRQVYVLFFSLVKYMFGLFQNLRLGTTSERWVFCMFLYNIETTRSQLKSLTQIFSITRS